ncbi:hypothetical protein Anas_03827 [Armadillidium nasatum]|uniref:Uncharacterized protein n=1 Tax=Armadillidium nasatum TaxID=96803 RepID=A0A5N5T1G2_9CRUS|nr:hypothetical protein Anas_03827 [Armadillidium nasatum]
MEEPMSLCFHPKQQIVIVSNLID